MTTVTLNLPEDLQQFVANETQSGRYPDSAAYIRALIEQAKVGKANLDSLLIEGLESGPPIPLDANEWARIRAEVAERRTNG